jgi:hypothetical protein
MLTLRPTGLSSPAYQSWLDYVIVEDGRDVVRLHEDRHSRPEYRWFWSITVYVDPKRGTPLAGARPASKRRKRYSCANWQKCRTDSTPAPRPST